MDLLRIRVIEPEGVMIIKQLSLDLSKTLPLPVDHKAGDLVRLVGPHGLCIVTEVNKREGFVTLRPK